MRQTAHLLHTLHYAETVLWSPVLTVEESLVTAHEPDEEMSLLRRLVSTKKGDDICHLQCSNLSEGTNKVARLDSRDFFS